MADLIQYYGTGRRKSAIARVFLRPGSGEFTVNGKKFDSAMPPQEAALTDAQIADVLTYITNAWGNSGDAFTTDQVKAIRNQIH